MIYGKQKKKRIIKKRRNKTIKKKNKKLNTNKIGNEIDNHMIEIMLVASKNKNHFINLFKKHLLQNKKITKKEKLVIEEIFKINKINVEDKLKTKKINKSKKINLVTTKKTKKTKKNKKNKLFNLKGGEGGEDGPYLQRLTGKGDQPITGNDVSKTLEEILEILGDLRQLDDFKGAKEPTVFLNYLNGNVDSLKSYLRYSYVPKFYSLNPPMINIKKIYERWDNIVDFLNLYKHDKKIKNEWAVSKGLKPEDVLKPTFIDNLADKIDAIDTKYQSFSQKTNINSFKL